MITRTFTTFDTIITSTRYQEWFAGGFMLIPLVFGRFYWIQGSRLKFLPWLQVITNIVVDSKGRRIPGFTIIMYSYIIFIASINLWGLIPLTFPVTRHISLTLSWSILVWGTLVGIGFLSYESIVSHLVPKGSGGLAPFLLVIELIRSIIRPLTLAFRLAANITAGHVILGLAALSGVGATLFYTIFEVAICLIQAYVFILLTVIYSNDYIYPHRLIKPWAFHAHIYTIYVEWHLFY